ncbi:solute carrier family 2, facilitated glucose transporter member 8-like [Ctenocephalides felis]|uniref:solute carrier family 2, facilitated glucose transporter member 8-like n=1 Tax=Ctenocephalides felis TaxID=7515 RepID=UPI000E6E2341|nr:solute carrier family 2, facilitated glucose transporter member 8-like [Ctenocephalides felis]
MGSTIKQYYAAFVANIATICYGTTIGWSSPALSALSTSNPSPGKDIIFQLTDEEASWIGGLICIGALFGGPLYAWLAGVRGRKFAGYMIVVPYIISWLCILFAESVLWMFAGRAFSGIAGGGVIVLIPMYVSEIADDNIRGALGSLLVLCINSGILVGYLLGACVSYFWLNLILTTLPFLFLVLFFTVPESPIWLARSGRLDDASRALCWLKGLQPSKSEDEQTISCELDKLKPKDDAQEEGASFMELLSSKCCRRGLFIGISLMFFQQACGLFAVLTYASSIMQQAGVSGWTPDQAAVILGAIQVVGGLVSSVFVERAGRKILLAMSSAFLGLCLAALGTHAGLRENGYDVTGWSWVPVTSLCGAVLFGALGTGPLPFVVASEIFDNRAKGKAMTICNLSLWIFAFIVLKFYSSMVSLMTMPGTFMLFAAFMALSTIFAVFCVPETKGQPLDVILAKLGAKAQNSVVLQEKPGVELDVKNV